MVILMLMDEVIICLIDLMYLRVVGILMRMLGWFICLCKYLVELMVVWVLFVNKGEILIEM